MGRLSLIRLTCQLTCCLTCTITCSMIQAEDHNVAYKLLQKGQILPLGKILQINHKQIQGKVLDVELERENKQLIYEIEVLNDNGVVWEYKINAKTGGIIKKELD